MSSSINLSLTDELRSFVDANSGDGTLYTTPSEFIRDLIRQHKHRQDACAVRDAIIEGYQDAIAGRTHAFTGDLRSLLNATAGDIHAADASNMERNVASRVCTMASRASQGGHHS